MPLCKWGIAWTQGDQLPRRYMKNLILIGLGLAVLAGMLSCKSNHICPSFESAFILDQEIRDQTFSLFDEDTLPREDFVVNKNKFGIIKSVSYRKKRDQMRTVEMETIFPQVEPPDTMLLAEQDLSPEEMEQILMEGERPVNHYNVDQIYYMRHFGQYLPMPEEPSDTEVEESEEEIPLEEPAKVKKKQWWQFWKKKDQMLESDSLNYGFQEDLEETEEELSKKELRQLEQEEKERQEAIEESKQPSIVDLDDFEKDRENATASPASGDTDRKSRKQKTKKKLRLGFGKKKKQESESIEIIEDDQ